MEPLSPHLQHEAASPASTAKMHQAGRLRLHFNNTSGCARVTPERTHAEASQRSALIAQINNYLPRSIQNRNDLEKRFKFSPIKEIQQSAVR